MRPSVTIVKTDNDKFLVEMREYDYTAQTSRITRIVVVDSVAEAMTIAVDCLK